MSMVTKTQIEQNISIQYKKSGNNLKSFSIENGKLLQQCL